MAILNAQLDDVQVQEGFDILPPGDYMVQIVDSAIKEGGKGAYIQWTFQVIGKPNKLWDVMSLNNPISRSRLKTMAMCCGHPNPDFLRDTEDLHGKECMVHLKVEKDETGQYADKNRITSFKPPKRSENIPHIPIPQAVQQAMPVQQAVQAAAVAPVQQQAQPVNPTPAAVPPPEVCAAAGNGGNGKSKMPWDKS